MEEGNKYNEKDIKEWLIAFEKQVGEPVVISLLIEQGNIIFQYCTRKDVYVEINEPDHITEEPQQTTKIKSMATSNKPLYFG